MNTSPTGPLSLDLLAQQFIAELRQGGRPDVEDYARRHPELAAGVREVFPALLALEAPGHAPAVPERLGEYRLVREVGRGGMGVVYEAVQESVGRRVALKVLAAHLVGSTKARERFHREALAAGGLAHPHIVAVHGAGEAGGVAYLAMQFIDGEALDAYTRPALAAPPPLPGPEAKPAPPAAVRRLPLAQAVAAVRDAAQALHYAHGEGVLHRDVKPSNLILDRDGHVWVTDFGLAKGEGLDDLSGTGDLIGTIRYMAPERFRGWADPRSDVYALGLTLYELLTGRPTFAGEDQADLIYRISEGAAPRPRQVAPSVPRDVETVILKAMAREPTARYASAGEMADDLERFLAGRPVLARRAGTAEHVWRWARRNPLLAGALSAVLLLLVLLAVGGTVGSFWLSAAEGQVREQLGETQTAERLARRRLYEALRAQARASVVSGRPGQRRDALAALAEAVRLIPEDLDNEATRLAMRNEYVAALALMDVRQGREVDLGFSIAGAGAGPVAIDPAFARYAAVAPDGTLVVGRLDGKGEARRWPRRGPRSINNTLLRHSPDGRYLCLQSSKLLYFDVEVWDLIEGKQVIGGQRALWAALRADRRELVLLSYTEKGLLWRVLDLGSGAETRRFRTKAMHQFALHPSQGRATAFSFYGNLIQVDLDTGQVRWARSVPSMRSLAWSPDGRLLAVGLADRLVLLDAETGQDALVMQGKANEVSDLEFAPTGVLLASCSPGEGTRFWDVRTGRLALQVPVRTVSLRFSREGRALGCVPTARGLALLDIDVPGELRFLTYPNREESRFATAHPGGRVAAFGTGGALHFYDLETGAELGSLPPVEQAVFASDGRSLTAGGPSGVKRWPVTALPDGGLRLGPPEVLLTDKTMTRVTLSRDGRTVVAYTSGKVYVRQPGGSEGRTFASSLTGQLAVSPDGRWLTGAPGLNDHLAIWDLQHGGKKLVPRGEGASRCHYVAFTPDGRWLVLGTFSEFQFWEVGPWRLGRRISLPQTGSAARLVAFPLDGRAAAIIWVGASRLIDPLDGRELVTLTTPDAHAGTIGRFAFTPDGGALLVSTNHRRVEVWDLIRIRHALRPLGLDWTDAPLPPLPTAPPKPITVVVEGK